MQTITFCTSDRYDVFVKKEILDECGSIISKLTQSKKTVIVTDDKVDRYYSQRVIKSLENSGIHCDIFVFKNGEASKCHKTLINLYEFLTEKQITRSDFLVALGGGVVGDLTGFAAATYLRGIDFVQIPTTLLAQTDSSLGGKTAVDIASGKNLVGAFKQPLCVITDIDTLKTLDKNDFEDGMSEIIKYGMIKSKTLFDVLSDGNIQDNMNDIICECINIKKSVVECDEFDKGQRMLLNFGHTLAHSIEKYYNYTGITHGKAVSIGMCMITKISEGCGITESGTYDKLVKCLERFDLPTSTDIDMTTLVKTCLSDKKRENESINLVLCEKIGKSYIKKYSLKDFFGFMGVSNV